MSTSGTPGQKGSRALRQRVGRALGAIAGIMGIGAAMPSSQAQEVEYRSATTVPDSWRQFAATVQQQIRQRLDTDEEAVLAARRLFEDQTAMQQGSHAVVSRVWIGPGGRIQRVEFDHLDPHLSDLLRGVLAGIDVGALPPPDMLQPLHLKLSLDPKG